MKVLLLEKNRILKTNLPKVIEGNYWITNESKKNLVNIESKEGKWFVKSNRDIKIALEEPDDNISSFYEQLRNDDECKLYFFIIINTDWTK